MMNYKIAETYDEVYNSFYALKSNFFSFDGDLASFSEKIYKNGICFICSNESVCGIIAFYANDFENKTAYITSVMVAQHTRGRGIATELISRAEMYAIEKGMKKMCLEVNRENSSAISLYSKIGYTVAKQRESSLIMEKILLRKNESL